MPASRTGGVFAAAGLAVATFAPPAHACDSTACAAAARSAEGALRGGQWRLDVSLRHVDESRRLRGSSKTETVTRPRVDLAAGALDAGAHNELSGAMTAVQVELSRAFGDAFSAHLALPLFHRASIEHVHYAAPGGGVSDADHAHPSSGPGAAIPRSDSASGLGDLRLGVQRRLLAGDATDLAAALTLKLPTGPARIAADDGVADPMLQPGTGSTDVALTLQYTRRLTAGTAYATVSAQKAGHNGDGYQRGDEVILALGGTRVFSPRLIGALQLKVQHVGRHSLEHRPVASTGGDVVTVAPGLRLRVRPSFSLYGSLQIPAYTRVNESQLAPRVTMTAGIATAF